MKVINKQTNNVCDVFIWDGIAEHVPTDLLNASGVTWSVDGNFLTINDKVVYLGASIVLDEVTRVYWSTRTLVKYYDFQDEKLQSMYEKYISDESSKEKSETKGKK